MNRMQQVEVRMYRAGMFLPVGGSTEPTIPPVLGPLPELPPPYGGDSAAAAAPGAGVEQYNAQCTTTNILTCVPACNSTTHGYELLATIDGTDTKFSCSLSNLLYSWVGSSGRIPWS